LLRSFHADNVAIFWHVQKWEAQLREKGDATKADKLALRISSQKNGVRQDSTSSWFGATSE
jgi:hypothetical protein